MKKTFPATIVLIALALALILPGCKRKVQRSAEIPPASIPSPSPVGLAESEGIEELEMSKTLGPEVRMLTGPNAVPRDTRIVVNIPAFRMDVFQDGSLIKSYKIGIGYPEFPLPTGLRKAQTIIFNPTWTPPDSPWVVSMKDVIAGEKIEAGSSLNPLGPVKIPIGMPSLIHGGKPLSKLGTFASHGCVGLTNTQVKEFAKVLAGIGGAEISDQTMASHWQNKTKTRVVKLKHIVPVELRYETIVVQDGKLHIYRDVYDHNTNAEENLRAALQANGIKLEDLTGEERTQVTNALNALGKKQKEIVVEIAALQGKGYPAPIELDTETGMTKVEVARSRP